MPRTKKIEISFSYSTRHLNCLKNEKYGNGNIRNVHLAEDIFLYSSLLLFLIGPSRCFAGPSSLSVIRSSESSSTSVRTVVEILCFCPDNVSTEVALRRSSFVFPIFSEAVFFISTCFVVLTSLAFSAAALSAAAFSVAAFSAAAFSAAAFSAAAFSAAACNYIVRKGSTRC